MLQLELLHVLAARRLGDFPPPCCSLLCLHSNGSDILGKEYSSIGNNNAAVPKTQGNLNRFFKEPILRKAQEHFSPKSGNPELNSCII